MGKPKSLSDLQLAALSAAANRPAGNLMPLCAALAGLGAQIVKEVPLLLRRGLIEERAVSTIRQSWRSDKDQAIGLLITVKGRAAVMPIEAAPIVGGDCGTEEAAAPVVPVAIGETVAVTTGDSTLEAMAADTSDPAATPRSKRGRLIALLERPAGATLRDMSRETGWQPHTTRAALTGLRKQGHQIVRGGGHGASVYRIAKPILRIVSSR
jgi:hypothetical protein